MASPAKRTVGLGDKAAAVEAPQPKRVSKLLRAAALAHVSDELAGMPENQDMLVFLPDVGRGRYDAPELKCQILPLLKPLFNNQPRPSMDCPLEHRPFTDEELRKSFNIPVGPSPLTVKEQTPEEMEQVERLRRQKKANKKRAREAELAESRTGADVASSAAKKQRV